MSNTLTEFNLDKMWQLNVKQVKWMFLSLHYIHDELAAREKRR